MRTVHEGAQRGGVGPSIEIQGGAGPSSNGPSTTKDKSFTCQFCERRFQSNSHKNRHVLSVHHPQSQNFSCQFCSKTFGRNDDAVQHQLTHAGTPRFPCELCGVAFKWVKDLKHHKKITHVSGAVKRKNTGSSNQITKKAKKNHNVHLALDVFTSFSIFPSSEVKGDLLLSCNEFLVPTEAQLNQILLEKHAIKWYLVLEARFSRTNMDGETEFATPFFRSRNYTELTPENIHTHIEQGFGKIKASFEEFLERGSGWILEEVLHLEVKSAKYTPLAGSSYIPLPRKLQVTGGILNIQNFEDSKCLQWCILAALHPVPSPDHSNRIQQYESFVNTLNMDGVDFPTPHPQIDRVEKQNDLGINVFGYDEEIFPLRITNHRSIDPINLLLISDDDKQHYCLIKNMSRLLSNLTHHNGQVYYCNYCLHRFIREDLLQSHIPFCKNHGLQKIQMPSDFTKDLYFKNVNFQHFIDFVIYADFETIIRKVDTCSPDPQRSYLTKLADHDACGYAFVIIGPDGKSVKAPSVYRGENAVDHFLEALLVEKDNIKRILRNVVPLVMSEKDTQDFNNAINCSVCHTPLQNDRVRDHNHLTGQYRSALHSKCNLQYKKSHKIPVIFHNLNNFDSHILMMGLGKIKNHQLTCIPYNMEKFMSFALTQFIPDEGTYTLQFIDSLNFLPTSLDKLVSNLKEDDFKILKAHFPEDLIPLLIRKGVYPYDHCSSFSCFEEKKLPPIEAFYNTLTEQAISQDDYKHAQGVWRAFNMQTLGDYHDLYVLTDVLQLADIFQSFRLLCLEYYQIDPTHIFSAPGLSWQACLRMTNIHLELLTDLDMHLFLERGIRGGISMISNRFSKANNKYLPDHDVTQQDKYLLYLDANNLYGWAMSQPLPVGGFSWISPSKFTEEIILSHTDDNPIGYIFEVDLEYPEALHDSHSDYPLAVERLVITPKDFSPYTTRLASSLYIKDTYHSEKLIPNLRDKSCYVLHYRNLKQYLQLGLKLVQIHKVLKFNQKAWLSKYIDFNTEQRKNATTSFEKDFFKLMNNSVYGKTMENLRNRLDVQLVSSHKKAIKLVASPAFHSFNIITEDLVAIERKKTSLLLNRPIYVGFSILELSKLHMYNFHYNEMKVQYGSRVKLLFTDTDSLCYEICTADVYADMALHTNLYDTSDYPTDHFLHNEHNKKKIGVMKDELNGVPGIEFVGLRAKMYSLKSLQGTKKTAKGVGRVIVAHKITHENYKTCLFSETVTRETSNNLISRNHRIMTVRENKIALSPFDDKRYLLSNGVDTLAHGHFKIQTIL